MSSSSNASIQSAAQILADRRRQGLSGPVLPDAIRPRTLDQAWAIQRAITALMGDEVAGWKCGMPGPDKWVVAPIYARTVHSGDAPCPVWAHDGHVRVEPELAFVIGGHLPTREAAYEPHEVDAAIARTHLALELIGSRYDAACASSLTFADKLADGLVNQGLFIGPQVDGEVARLTHAMPITVELAGQPERVLAGQHPEDLPRLPLYWLAEFLRSQGLSLKAGQVVITGSYVAAFPLPLGQAVSLAFGDLGRLALSFTAR